MLDSVLDMVKGQVGGLLSENGLDASKAGDLMNLSGESIKETATSEIASGNVDGLLSLFNGESKADNSNPIMSSMMSGLTSKITSSLGVGGDSAGSMASGIMPMIIQGLISKFTGGSDGGIGAITSLLGMEDGGGMLDKAKGMLGGLFGK